jgi:hypothetical protein
MDTTGRQDRKFECKDCGQIWTLTIAAQLFFEERGLTWPRRCSSCRAYRRRERAAANEHDADQDAR